MKIFVISSFIMALMVAVFAKPIDVKTDVDVANPVLNAAKTPVTDALDNKPGHHYWTLGN